MIGRDRSKWWGIRQGWSYLTNCCSQYVINDPSISKKHLRIYSVVYDNDNPDEVDVLVYAEDLSSNGTYWNGSLIGQGNGGFLLSLGDMLKVASNVFLEFQVPAHSGHAEYFDAVQEIEMLVGHPSTVA
jgi:pSer/pThr/pTyr-binding forkhead associated (FHA) protein